MSALCVRSEKRNNSLQRLFVVFVELERLGCERIFNK
jgi:hypothetical protein